MLSYSQPRTTAGGCTASRREMTRPAAEAASLLNRIENFVRTQETLNSLNGVMHSMGEPAFILFPTIVNGLLTRFELSYGFSEHIRRTPNPAEREEREEIEEREQGRKRDQRNHRVRFRIQLAALGEVEVDFIHELQGARIRLRSADGLVAEFLDGELPALGGALQDIGVRPLDLRSEQGELDEV